MRIRALLVAAAPLGCIALGALYASVASTACVPTGSSPPFDAGATPTQTSSFKPSVGIMTAPFEDNFDRPDSGDALSADVSAVAPGIDAAARRSAATGDAGVPPLFADAGEPAVPSNLGPNWTQAKTNAWRIENGKLCGENAHNHGVWLNRTLPVNARIEFDAVSYSKDGDIKAEVWGDGHAYAKGNSYVDATSYIAIFGAWKNTKHALARLNEHGRDVKEIPVDKEADDPRQHPISPGQVYQVKIERTDGKTVKVSVNGHEYFTWADGSPLAGQGHDHMGFNDWEAKVCFDNVKVTPL